MSEAILTSRPIFAYGRNINPSLSYSAENLGEVDDLPISEAAFDNAFPNTLVKRFLDKKELKMDVYL